MTQIPSHHTEEYHGWDIHVALDEFPRRAIAIKPCHHRIERAGESYDEAIENVKGEIDALLEAGS